MAGTNYINGSDLLLKVGEKAVGHCTTHTLTFESETKDRAVKPVAEAPVSAGLWKGKGVTGLSISVSAEGLRFYEETENGYEEISALWGKGQSVDVEAFPRGGDGTPYLKGKFVITSLEETSPAQDDATYTVELENDGEPEVYPGKAGAKSYGEVSVELSYPTIPAAGGKASPVLSYSQEWGLDGRTSGGGGRPPQAARPRTAAPAWTRRPAR